MPCTPMIGVSPAGPTLRGPLKSTHRAFPPHVVPVLKSTHRGTSRATKREAQPSMSSNAGMVVILIATRLTMYSSRNSYGNDNSCASFSCAERSFTGAPQGAARPSRTHPSEVCRRQIDARLPCRRAARIGSVITRASFACVFCSSGTRSRIGIVG